MKTFTAFKKVWLLFFVANLTFSCNNDDEVSTPFIMEPETITEIAVANSDLSSLVAALTRANLAATLDGEGSFTVFAPTNDAFSTFLTSKGFASLEDVPVEVLKQILLNHVISGEITSGSLVTGYGKTLATEATSGDNISIYINTNGGVRLNGISSVTQADINASNGVIHVVDSVIGLPTVVDFALADSTFSILVEALTRSDLTTDYVGVLSSANGTAPAPFTVFAPTNDAFVDLLAELSLSGLGDIDEPTLNATLSYHAVAGMNVRSSDLSDNFTVPTLGGDITANITGGATLTDANNRVSDIIAIDVQASNGVIHVINKVVLPPL